jgi:hypothetical protein
MLIKKELLRQIRGDTYTQKNARRGEKFPKGLEPFSYQGVGNINGNRWAGESL